MKFGRMAVAAAEGAILAHAVKANGISLHKGEIITETHVNALEAAGLSVIVGARLEPDDVPENVAAARLAERIAGRGTRLEAPFTGRCNLLAQTSGLVVVDASCVDAVNAHDEAITVATLPPWQPVVPGEMIATVKIIPFAIPGRCFARAFDSACQPAIQVAPFLPLRVGVVSTMLPALKSATVSKTLQVLQRRLDPAGARVVAERRVPHDVAPLAEAIAGMVASVDLLVIFGASAITDRRDVVPLAIEQGGGRIEHLGMPVDPGNLLLLARIAPGAGLDGRPAVPVIGAPGCARSAKENGFDFVLRRFLAGFSVTGADLRRMGVGGLLSEIASRPQARQAGGGDG